LTDPASKDEQSWIVLRNHVDQYSLWLARKEIPDGWAVVKTECSKEEALAYVRDVWTDMRPHSDVG
jgi:MbtH protein